MTLPKRMVVAQFSSLLTVVVSSLEKPVSKEQLNKDQDSTEVKIEWYYAVAMEDTSKNAMHCTEQVRFNGKYVKWKNPLIGMISRDAAMWDGRLGRISVAKHFINLNPSDAASINATQCRAEL